MEIEAYKGDKNKMSAMTFPENKNRKIEKQKNPISFSLKKLKLTIL